MLKDIRILTIADTHYELTEKEELRNMPKNSEYDICLCLGDISKEDLYVLLKYIPSNKMIGILGNHDYKNTLEVMDIKNIHNELVEINGTSFVGLERCVKYVSGQLAPTQEESYEICRNLPKADILISHETPVFMAKLYGTHAGNPAINEYLEANDIPLCICAHNHVNYIGSVKDTPVIATYMINLIEIKDGKIKVTPVNFHEGE